MKRKKLKPEVEAEVLVLSRRRCCLCFGLERGLDLKAGQIAHLDRDPGNNSLDNLAYLCLTHHDQYDSRASQSKGMTPLEVRRYRRELHEAIGALWRQPGVLAIEKDDVAVSGRYVRDGEFSNAELQVMLMPDGAVRVTGLAYWGLTREFGPNMGTLDFRADLVDGKAVFVDARVAEDEYRIELTFHAQGLTAAEQYALGYFGMNVSFEGQYRRVS